MEDPSTIGIRKSALLNHVVINLETAEELGVVTEVLVDGRNHRLLGLVSGGGRFSRGGQRIPLAQIASVGRDGVVIRPGSSPEDGEPPFEGAIAMGDLELWSDSGDRIGQLKDFRFNPKTGAIHQYLFAAGESSGLAPGLYAFTPEAVVSTGRRRMLAHDTDIRQATLISNEVPLSPPFRNEPFSPNIPDPRRGWETTMEETRDLRERVGGQMQEHSQRLKAEAQNRLGHLFGDVKKRTRRLRNQLRETVTDVTAGLPTGRSLRDEDVPTIDVDSMETWAETPEDNPRREPR